MNSRLEKRLGELQSAQVITPETALKITAYYKTKQEAKPNRLFTIFGILGALLCGLGIILIIAHNWDDMPRTLKTVFAFLPMIIGQISSAYSLIKKKGITWTEASATFLILSVGATISLVSQIYNIPGNLADFLLVWVACAAPLMYLLRSNMAVIFHLILITWYACDLGYFYNSQVPWWYLLLFAFAIPSYISLQTKQPRSNIAGVMSWLLPLSLVIVLGTFTDGYSLSFIIYLFLFGLFYNLGQLVFFKQQGLRRNGFTIIGSLGTVFVLIMLTFEWFWKDALKDSPDVTQLLIAGLLFFTAIIVVGYLHFKKQLEGFNLFQYAFLFLGLLYLTNPLGHVHNIIMTNLLVAILGLFAVRIGINTSSYGILNYGLLIITALIFCRFFDTNLDFIVRGILFISVGFGFFFANYLLLRKQRRVALNVTPKIENHE